MAQILLPLSGGVLIGLAVTLMLWLNGRVTGISGIINGMLFPVKGDIAWRIAFVLGLFLGGLTINQVIPSTFTNTLPTEIGTSIVAGLLVGFGTVMGSGCTSGHGVCGISRLSPRSLVATAIFISAGVLAVAVFRHWGEFSMKNVISSLIVGFIFSLGLGISGMTQPQNVVGFLDVFGDWNPSLIFVMIGAITVHFFTYRLIRRRDTPLLSPQWYVPTKRELTPALVIGSIIFGVGWGLAGFCPGPAIAALASFEVRPAVFVSSMLLGMVLFRAVDKKLKIQK